MTSENTPKQRLSARHLQVVRTARYFTLGPDPGEVDQLWIALHGYAMLAERFLRQLEPLGEWRASLIVAPEALSRFYLETTRDGRHSQAIGATWLTREDREADLADTLRYLDRLHAELAGSLRSGATVGILGFSQGAAMAARWVAGGATLPDQLVLWGVDPPADAMPGVAERMQGREVTLIAGDQDPLAPSGGIEVQARALAQKGVRARAERFDGGHALDPGALRRLAGAGPAP
jgi:predicted esterase